LRLVGRTALPSRPGWRDGSGEPSYPPTEKAGRTTFEFAPGLTAGRTRPPRTSRGRLSRRQPHAREQPGDQQAVAVREDATHPDGSRLRIDPVADHVQDAFVRETLLVGQPHAQRDAGLLLLAEPLPAEAEVAALVHVEIDVYRVGRNEGGEPGLVA